MSTGPSDAPNPTQQVDPPTGASEEGKADSAGVNPDEPKPTENSADTTQAAQHEAPQTSTETGSKPSARFHLPWLGTRSQSDKASKSTNALSPLASPDEERRRVTFDANRTNSLPMSPVTQQDTPPSQRNERRSMDRRRPSINPRFRPEEEVYHDSRAATKREFRRRATTLQAYYRENPTFLPQLPFTFRHGFKRWKIALLIIFMVFDACVVPIILYYAMIFGGDVEGYIAFAVITAIWGGPAYFEFAIRSLRLIKKERFFRPLGTSSRWSFDITNWIFVVSITATTALLIVGAAPHIVWLRVLSLPGPALLLVLGGCIGLMTIYNFAGWNAPFRISSTPKGGKVHPGVYYIVEDIVAVNAGGGLPFREGWAARYEASPIFRKMIRDQSLYWSIGATVMGIVLTVIVCVHSVKKEVAYGVGWAVPFIWAAVWAAISVPWVRRELHRETVTWESVCTGKIEKGEISADNLAAQTSDTNVNTV